MPPMGDPLQVNNMLKLATICLNSESKYVYVCYHCDSSFTEITDTLCHVEMHYDTKVNIPKQFVMDETVGIGVFGTSEKMPADRSMDDGQALSDGIKLEPIEVDEANEYEMEPVFPEVVYGEPSTQCRLCDQQFPHPSTLIVHLMESHAKATKFKCPACSQSYSNESTFLNHLFIGHIQCNETTYDAVIDHIISTCDTAAGNRPFTKYQMRFLKTCDICSEQFSNTKHIRRHMREVHVKTRIIDHHTRKDLTTGRVLDCNKCNLQFFKRFNFYAHLYGHLTYDDRVSDMDDRVLRRQLRQFLDDNIFQDESSPDKPMFQCKLCRKEPTQGRKSAEYHILQRHIHYMRPKTLPKEFTCDQCNKKFVNASNLESHKKILHAPLTSTVQCTVCNKSFPHKSYLKSHMFVHSETRRHQCPECGKTFKILHQMRKHSRTHSEETVQCPICNKELKTYRLQDHIKDVHESEHRPYSCPVCSLAFKTKKTLTNHSYRHTGERKFACRFNSGLDCKERFISTAARRAHERSKHESR
ncbi:PR domain zinc finger protein 5-like isoform X2 [Bradysia coprophila]|uniref:PR domain zinc finger protein 5-like isoform X2 n=1 Tax=Bradysia coprophila TaxID=38358 RepID=UPI00187DB2EA|nr:PR domain zinc finger protein 5-like isoform X2 [Bradysia coprophila]